MHVVGKERQNIQTRRTTAPTGRSVASTISYKPFFGSNTRLEAVEGLSTLSALILDHLQGIETDGLRERAALA